MKAGIIKK